MKSKAERKESQPERKADRRGAEGTPYGELLTAALRLNELVEGMRESPKKNQSKLASALYGLIHKYGRR